MCRMTDPRDMTPDEVKEMIAGLASAIIEASDDAPSTVFVPRHMVESFAESRGLSFDEAMNALQDSKHPVWAEPPSVVG